MTNWINEEKVKGYLEEFDPQYVYQSLINCIRQKNPIFKKAKECDETF
jgi:hypothetical protein